MQHIIRHLFQVDRLEEVPRERLEELVSAHPAYSVGRYLLSRKLQTEDAGHFSEETQKTNLYFTNPFWLQWLLQNEVEERPVYARTISPADAAAEETIAEMPAREWNRKETVEEPVTEAPAEERDAEETAAEAQAEEPLAEIPEAERDAEVMLLEEEQSWGMPDIAEQPAAGGESALANEPDVTEAAAVSGEEVVDGEAVVEKDAVADAGGREGQENPGLEGEEKRAIDHEPVIVNEPGAQEELVEEARSLRQTLADRNEPVREQDHSGQPAEPVVEFEPYHTIDYFASLGIKLLQDENPSDKLGKQLKSFTDWLKVMRKLPQKNNEIIPDVAAEHQIQAIAAHSIKGKDVVTETMAEVLVKQGMREKAMEVYHKLSLLNPDKSAYFATRIEQLKID